MPSEAAQHRPSATQARPRLPQGHPGPSLPRGNRQLRHAIDIRPARHKQAASAMRPAPSGQVPGRRAAETHRKAVEQRRIKTGGQPASPRHEHSAGHLCGGRVACTGGGFAFDSASSLLAAWGRRRQLRSRHPLREAEIRVEGFCPAALKDRPAPLPRGNAHRGNSREPLRLFPSWSGVGRKAMRTGIASCIKLLRNPLDRQKRDSGEQVTAANPSLCRRLSSARPRFSRRLAG